MTPEAKPEPVAWMESPHGGIRANPLYKITFPSQLLSWSIPLYMKQTPLTREQLLKLLASVDPKSVRLPPGLEQFARAVERAHGIGVSDDTRG
jgi:hypothetical protein